MTTQVPIRCVVVITLTCDIDISEKEALKNRMSTVVTDLKTQFPDKIIENKIEVKTEFAEEKWAV